MYDDREEYERFKEHQQTSGSDSLSIIIEALLYPIAALALPLLAIYGCAHVVDTAFGTALAPGFVSFLKQLFDATLGLIT